MIITYQINQFNNGINLDNLQLSIKSNPGLDSKYAHCGGENVGTENEIINIHFNNELTEQELSDLEQIRLNHDSSPLVYVLTNKQQDPRELDYDIMDCVKKRILGTGDHKGELREIEYYKNYNVQTNTFSNLAVKERRRYIRQPITGLVMYRLTDIDWYMSNGSIGVSKNNIMKVYSFNEARIEMQSRRSNIINDVEAYLLYYQSQNYGEQGLMNSLTLLASLKPYKELYIDSVGQPLLDAINSSNYNFMDQILKDTMCTMLTYDPNATDIP